MEENNKLYVAECDVINGDKYLNQHKFSCDNKKSFRCNETSNIAQEILTKDNNDDKINKNKIDSTKSKHSINSISSNPGKEHNQEIMSHIFSEDMRISKIIRRLCVETNPLVAIELCEKLQAVIMDPSNATYIRRAFDFLAESVILVFHQGPIECLEHVAKVFGMLGYVVRNEFPIYKNWLVRTYDTSKDIRIFIIQSLKTTIKYDSSSLDLMHYSDRILIILKDWLEGADVVENFVVLSGTIAEFSKIYKKSFEKHFTDIVDIIIGWHLETEQSPKLKRHCSYVLQQFSEFFIKIFDFTSRLLEQFLEDIITFGEDIEPPPMVLSSSSTSSPADNKISPEISVGSFIGAFVSVMKCLSTDRELIAFKLNKKLFNDAISIISRIACQSLRKNLSISSSSSSYEIVQSINEFFIIILSQNDDKIEYDPNKIYEIIEIEIDTMKMFNVTQINCLLYLLVTYISTLKAETPIEMISFILNPKCTEFAKIKFSRNKNHYKLVVKLYHKILAIKNVPLLQEAYRFILMDMKLAVKCLNKEGNNENVKNNNNDNNNSNKIIVEEYSILQAECVLNFYFSAITTLATQTSSIIGMYALHPSILELLIIEMNASNIELWIKYPILHDALIKLLSVHSLKNHNYVLSSNLLMTNVFSKLSLDDTSPTSKNFMIILEFFVDILIPSKNTTYSCEMLSEKIVLMIINWICAMYEECIQHADFLQNHPLFTNIAKGICILSVNSTSIIILEKCANCMKLLLKYPKINLKVLNSITEVCCVHMLSTNNKIKIIYSNIFARLPLGISMRQSYKMTGLFKYRENELNGLQRWYFSSQTQCNLRERYFKCFIEKIKIDTIPTEIESSTGNDTIDIFIKDIFPKCWIYKSGKVEKFFEIIQSDWNSLVTWIQWEAAQYCVNNKLRTFLGKPQETFVKIETIIKDYARVLALKNDSNISSIEKLLENQENAKIILGFVEYLEKAIYNAADGTAFALPSPEKPVRTFFRLNTSTCNEWFSRIRTAVNLIAIHTMQPEIVIRNSEVMLQMLVTSNCVSDAIFEHTIVSLVWALMKNCEVETLHGLYIWTKKVSGKRLQWIKYAAEHAAGYQEKAAEGYMEIISSADQDKIERSTREFLIEQIVECFYYTGKWKELNEIFMNEYIGQTDQKTTINLMSLAMPYIQSVINSNEMSNHNSIFELTNWEIIDQDKNDYSNNYSCHNLLFLTENTLADIVLNKRRNSNITNQLDICTNIVNSGLQQYLRTKTKVHLNTFIILNYVIGKIADTHQQTVTTMNIENIFNFLPLITENKMYGFKTLINVMHWLKLLQPSECLNELNLQIVKLSRKEGNLKFCQQELNKFFKQKDVFFLKATTDNLDEKMFEQVCSQIIESDKKFWTKDILYAVSELGKCWFNSGDTKKQDNAIQLVSSCCISAMPKIIISIQTEKSGISECLAKILLTLADWLLQDNNEVQKGMTHKPIQKLLSKVPNIRGYLDEKISSFIPTIDMAVGKLLQASTQQYPNLAKAWNALGNWFYRWGRKIVELRAHGHADKARLRATDIEAIKSLIVTGDIENYIEDIVKILNKHQVNVDDEEIGVDDVSSTELIENQLREVGLLKNVGLDVILSIIQIWKQSHKSIYVYYEMAVDSYFKYLNLVTSSTKNQEEFSLNNEDEAQNDSSTVTVTLRLLRLIVKHAIGLQEVLETGLATTPTKPWKVIIPQLFSRLNHHESYVRKRVSELLCRVAEDSPHLVIFPAVVGAMQEKKTELVYTDPISYLSKRNEIDEGNPLIFCYNSLLNILSAQASETVKQVKMLVNELKRVTLLRDEFWLYSLAQLYSEYSEIFNALESEIRNSTDDKLELLERKYDILMSGVANDMDHLLNIIQLPAETPYEKNFSDKYSKIIQSTINDLRRPLNYEKPNESWQKLKQLYVIFQQKSQKSSQLSLKMADLSPVLAKIQNTTICMPGLETAENNSVYISSVDNIVHILPTKTKPKKLAFFGSDGKRYTYLFKGLEDLHLDERIMQFLSISNSMMSKSRDCNGNMIKYRAHHYSVIPLGPRSGLISWVDGVTPIFALYKKWQQREAGNPKRDTQYTVMRPSEMFYNKLAPLLAEHNIKITDDRKTWPISVLRKVLDELTNETPKDLLAKELWCHASNPVLWREAIRTYSLSVAVMSVIGYVIGLGDRHLDNILIKLSTGDIVHIDYNVCFEKGKTLRVPERVPFRITQNLETALGITGIEGTFRLTCEHVLKILRKERETLLTLLEAFVYDPLVDWAVSDDGTTVTAKLTNAVAVAAEMAKIEKTFNGGGGGDHQTSDKRNDNIKEDNENNTKDSKKSISSQSPFPSARKNQSKNNCGENDRVRNTSILRLNDVHLKWIQYRNDVNELLGLIINNCTDLEKQRQQIKENENQRDLLSRQLAMIREVETLGTAISSHPLNTISQRYSIYKRAMKEYNDIKNILIERQSDYEKKYQSYFSLISYDENTFKKLLYEVDKLSHLQLDNGFVIFKDILENASQDNLYSQLDQAYKELNVSLMQQSFIIKVVLEALEQYLNVIKFIPKSLLMKNHRFEYYMNCFKKILENPDCCDDVLKNSREFLSDDIMIIDRRIPSEQIISYAYELNKIRMDIDFNLQKNYDLLQNELPEYGKQLLKELQDDVTMFLQVDSYSQKALQNEFVLSMCGFIENYVIFEKSYMNTSSKETFVQNLNNILDEHHTSLLYLTENTKIIFSNTELYSQKLTNSVDLLNLASNVIQSFRDADRYFQIEIIPKITCMFMLDSDSDVIQTFDTLIEILDVKKLDLIINKLNSDVNCYEDIEILKTVYEQNIKDTQNDEFIATMALIDQIFTSIYNSLNIYFDSIMIYRKDGKTESLDYILGSKLSMAPVFNEHVLNLYLQKLEILKFKTISTFISVSKEMTNSLKASNLQTMYDIQIMQHSIKTFIADCMLEIYSGQASYVAIMLQVQLIALTAPTSKAEEYLIDSRNFILSIIEKNISSNLYSGEIYTYAKTIFSNFNDAIKRQIRTDNLKQNLINETEILRFIDFIISAYAWMNEQVFVSDISFTYILPKNILLQSFQSAIQNLNVWHISINKIKEEIVSYIAAIKQNLKWKTELYSKILDISQSFYEIISKQETIYNDHMNISAQALTYCTTIMNFESLKTNKNEINENDKQFLYYVIQFNKIYSDYKIVANHISPIEEAIVQLLDPEGSVDHFWINNISELLNEMTDSTQCKIANLEKDLTSIGDQLQMIACKLKILINDEIHADIKCLLKSILNVDDSSNQTASDYKKFRNYYRQFLNRISDLHMKISPSSSSSNKYLSVEAIEEILNLINKLKVDIENINTELVYLAFDKFETHENRSGKSDKDNRRGNQVEQKRNAYAISVWRRIRMKLEGRDPDANHRLSIAEQIDWMIREAMNSDNLALLYEGWTPWV